jgi:hypothetical protein
LHLPLNIRWQVQSRQNLGSWVFTQILIEYCSEIVFWYTLYGEYNISYDFKQIVWSGTTFHKLMHELVLILTYTGVNHYFHIRLYSWRLTVARWVSHVEQELLTFLEHLSSSPVFSGVRVARSLTFCIMFCRSLIPLFVLFLLAIVLSVLLRLAPSDYPFGIFKLFFCSIL